MRNILLLTTYFTLAAIPTLPDSPKPVEIKTTSQELPYINSLFVSGKYRILLKKGPANLSISGREANIKFLNTTFEEGKLKISPHRGPVSYLNKLFNLRTEDDAKYQIEITITAPVLPIISLTDGVNASTTDDLGILQVYLSDQSSLALQNNSSPAFDFQINDTAKLTAHTIKAPKGGIDSSGSSKIDIVSLSPQILHITQTGNSQINMNHVKANTLTVDITDNAKTSIRKAQVGDSFFALYGASSTHIQHLNTARLYFKLHGGSQLNILSGEAGSSAGIYTPPASYTFKQFNPGIQDIHTL